MESKAASGREPCDGFDLTVIGVALPKTAESLKSGLSTLGLAVGAGESGRLWERFFWVCLPTVAVAS
jgi:hypothetical protein